MTDQRCLVCGVILEHSNPSDCVPHIERVPSSDGETYEDETTTGHSFPGSVIPAKAFR